MTYTILFLNSLPEYGWDDEYDFEDYVDDVKYVANEVLCWPRVPELLDYASKYNLIRKLDKIAETITHTERPRTILMGAKDEPPKGWMVKREHSDGGRHVEFPRSSKSKVMNNREGSYRWIAQEVAPLLRKLGEIRVVFVGQNPLYAVLTTPSKDWSWQWNLYQRPYSLARLR
jgi:hypothetical protein